MKVKELIEELMKQDQEVEVSCFTGSSWFYVDEVTEDSTEVVIS